LPLVPVRCITFMARCGLPRTSRTAATGAEPPWVRSVARRYGVPSHTGGG
jgi:hypothetical protein